MSFLCALPSTLNLWLFFVIYGMSLHVVGAQEIQFSVDCSGGPGSASIEVVEPVGAEWRYALDDGRFQAFAGFSGIFPGHHWLYVRNSSGVIDSVRVNTNCGLEVFSCRDCNVSGALFQVYTEAGSIGGLNIESNQFSNLPNSPAGFHINAIGMNPNDSLGYGMKRRFSNELIVVDAQGTAVKLGRIENLPIGDYTAGDFDEKGYLHIKEGLSSELFKIDVQTGKMIERYQLSRTLRTNDIAYNTADSLFYSVDNGGNLWSFSPIEKEVSLVGSSFLSGPIGAMYCDRSGRVFGILNRSGALYEFDTLDGTANFIMTTNNALYNDGFSCQNSYFNKTGPPRLSIECASMPGRANLRISQADGDDFEFKLNDGPFRQRRYYENLEVGDYELITRQSGACLPDTTSISLAPKYVTTAEFEVSACDSFRSPTGALWMDSGTYRDTLINAMGCDSIQSYTLSILESTSSIRGVETCDSFFWSGMMLDSTGIYTIETTNAVGCDSVAQLDLQIKPFLDTQLNITTCRPLTSPDGQALWDTSGMYADTLISAKGCDSIIFVNLYIGDVMADWQVLDPICPDRPIAALQVDTITHQGPHILVLDEVDSIPINGLPVVLSDLAAFDYELQFISADSCSSALSPLSITALEQPEISLLGPSQVDICDPPTLYSLASNLPGTQVWYSNSSLQCDTCRRTAVFDYQEGPLGVIFTANNECQATAEIPLEVLGLEAQYFIPNVFSPNGDGVNDYFTLFAGGGKVDEIELLEIYDRWGTRLFEARNIMASIESQGWNGWYRGRPASTGVYAYRIHYRYCDGRVHKERGTVTLVR